MSWATLATGEHPDRHGVGVIERRMLDEGTAADGTERAGPFWENLGGTGRRCAVVGWPGTRGEQVGNVALVRSGPWARKASETAWRAELGELCLGPEDVAREVLAWFIPRIDEIDTKRDARPARLRAHLAALYSRHNVAMALLSEEAPDFLAVCGSFLADVSGEFLAYHPPRRRNLSRADFEWYREVVTRAYQLADALTAELLRCAGGERNVLMLSTHGFALEEQAPRSGIGPKRRRVRARAEGWWLARGPAFRAGEAENTVVRLVDVASTVLAAGGVAANAVGRGRGRAELLARDAGATEREPLEKDQDDELGARLGELAPESAWRLGLALFDLGRPQAAILPLQQAYLAEPESPMVASTFAHCLLTLGLIESARRVAATLKDVGGGSLRGACLWARLHLQANRPRAALEALAAVEGEAASAEVRLLQAWAWLQLQQWDAAVDTLQVAGAIAPRDPLVQLGLAQAEAGRGNVAAASDAARAALKREPNFVPARRLLEEWSKPGGGRGGPPLPLPWAQFTAKAAERTRWRERLASAEKAFWQQRAARRTSMVFADGSAASLRSGADEAERGNAPEAWVIREPWLDEEARLERSFGRRASREQAESVWVTVAMAGAEERLVGAVALSVFGAGEGDRPREGRVELTVRAAWEQGDMARGLIGRVVRQARERGLARIEAQVNPRRGLAEELRQAGFELTRVHEIWEFETAATLARVEPAAAAVKRKFPIDIRQVEELDLPAVREICAETELLTPERVQLSDGAETGFDRRLSFAANTGDGVAAVVLARRMGEQVYLEVLARDPRRPDMPGAAAITVVLAAFLRAANDCGYDDGFCTILPQKAAEVRHVLKRRGAVCVREESLYTLALR